MKYKLPFSAAIFLTYFYKPGGGGLAPLPPPGSATGYSFEIMLSNLMNRIAENHELSCCERTKIVL